MSYGKPNSRVGEAAGMISLLVVGYGRLQVFTGAAGLGGGCIR